MRGTFTLVRLMLIGILTGMAPASVIALEPAPSGLPDIGMLPPTDFSIQNRPRGVRLLRFDTVVVNTGPGVFEVIGRDDPLDQTNKLRVSQLVQSESGVVAHETGAVMSYSGDGHNHWHVENLQHWTIVNANDAAARVLASGAKTGFCFWDNYRFGSVHPAYYYPGSDRTSACEMTADGVPMGLSVGWGDEYPSTIAYQYIDITGLPNGDYTVSVQADPENWFLEHTADDLNNVSWTRIRITRKGVEVLQYGPPPALPSP